MDYKISIILPVYNVEKYVEQSFDSIYNQTFGFSNMEVIFVDDCSTDRSPEIIDEYSREFDNVRAYHLEENSGFAGKPRNIGIDESSGEYILFLDSDDLLEEDACERLYEQIKDNPEVDLVVGGYTNIYPDGRIFTQVPEGFKGIYPDGSEVNRVPEVTPEVRVSKEPKRDFELYSLPAAISSKLFRKELLVKNSIYYEVGLPSQDTIFVYDAISNARQVAILNDYSVYNRNIRSSGKDKSTTFDVDCGFVMKLFKSYNIISDKCESNLIDEYVHPAVYAKMFSYLLDRIKKSGVKREDLDRIIATEEYSRFKNREFIKSHPEFDIVFENFYNLEDNYRYAAFLKSSVINGYKNKKRVRNFSRKLVRMTEYYERKLEGKQNQFDKLDNRYRDLYSRAEGLYEERREMNGRIKRLNDDLEKSKGHIAKLEGDIEELKKEKASLIAENEEMCEKMEEMENSTSWKATAPLRKMGNIVK